MIINDLLHGFSDQSMSPLYIKLLIYSKKSRTIASPGITVSVKHELLCDNIYAQSDGYDTHHFYN